MADVEAIYDVLISPLMAQIIDICKEEGVPMVARFQLTDDKDEDSLLCTTVIPTDWMSQDQIDLGTAAHRGCNPPQMAAFTVTTQPKEKDRG